MQKTLNSLIRARVEGKVWATYLIFMVIFFLADCSCYRLIVQVCILTFALIFPRSNILYNEGFRFDPSYKGPDIIIQDDGLCVSKDTGGWRSVLGTITFTEGRVCM